MWAQQRCGRGILILDSAAVKFEKTSTVSTKRTRNSTSEHEQPHFKTATRQSTLRACTDK